MSDYSPGGSVELRTWVAKDECGYKTRDHRDGKGEASLLLVKFHKVKTRLNSHYMWWTQT